MRDPLDAFYRFVECVGLSRGIRGAWSVRDGGGEGGTWGGLRLRCL